MHSDHTHLSHSICVQIYSIFWKEIWTNAHISMQLYSHSIRFLFIFVIYYSAQSSYWLLSVCKRMILWMHTHVMYACLCVRVCLLIFEFACMHICACICVHVGVYFWDCTSVISLLGKTGSFLLLPANAGHWTDISQHAHRLREWGTEHSSELIKKKTKLWKVRNSPPQILVLT